MNDNEKAALRAGTSEDGGGQLCFAELFVSADKYITAFEPVQGSIAAFLRRGRSSAITCRQLCDLTGLEPRQVTLRIMRERREGAPILSDTSGFWLAENAEEVARCVKRLHSRAGEIHRTARALALIARGVDCV